MAAKTPGARARARKTPTVDVPPVPPKIDRAKALRELQIEINGVKYLIGPLIEGDPQIDATISSAETVTINARDPSGKFKDLLSDEAELLKTGVFISLADIKYALQKASADETGLLTMIFEDEVAWRLRRYKKFLSVSRAKSTRAQFIGRMVDEAGAPPLEPLRFYCPEINDKQRISAPEHA